MQKQVDFSEIDSNRHLMQKQADFTAQLRLPSHVKRERNNFSENGSNCQFMQKQADFGEIDSNSNTMEKTG